MDDLRRPLPRRRRAPSWTRDDDGVARFDAHSRARARPSHASARGLRTVGAPGGGWATTRVSLWVNSLILNYDSSRVPLRAARASEEGGEKRRERETGDGARGVSEESYQDARNG